MLTKPPNSNHLDNKPSVSFSKILFIIGAILFSSIPSYFTPRIAISVVPMILSMFLKNAKLSRMAYVASVFFYLPVFLVFSYLGLYIAEVTEDPFITVLLILICILYILVGVLLLVNPHSSRDIVALVLATIASFVSIIALQNLTKCYYLPLGFGLPISFLFSYLVIADRFRELEKDYALLL